MVDFGERSSLFSRTNVSFESVITKGACGGAPAVESYLRVRKQMFLRDVSRITSRGGDATEHSRVVAAIDTAELLLAEFGHMLNIGVLVAAIGLSDAK